MIYLKNISTPQEIFIPKGMEESGRLVLEIKSTINQSVIMPNVIDFCAMELYFKFTVALPADVASGEHEYTLSDDAGVLSTGLLIVGEPSTPTEYNKIIQYGQSE